MRLDFEVLHLQTRHDFHIARAAAPPVRRNVWVRLTDRDGVVGWGEAAPNPYYGEDADTVTDVLQRYARVLERADVTDVAGLSLKQAHGGPLWNYSAPWYVTPTTQNVRNLFTRQQEKERAEDAAEGIIP